MNYYNEFDPYAAQWIRNLIAAKHIPKGHVDERSIVDVEAADISEFTQCHFFAGIGGWSLAARLAGWPDDRELWTGSAPCQPFSVAGRQGGQKDERHLWPEYFRLIGARRPAVVMGEQVAAAVGKNWLDGVFDDLESIHYACGATVIPACAVDAPHRRDRLWFVGHRTGAVGDGKRARDWKDTPGMSLTGPDGRTRVDQLPRQAAASLWATPLANLSVAASAQAALKEAKRLHPQGRWTLNTQVAELLDDLGIPHSGLSGTTGKLGGLNPEFVCWLMGFPIEWVNSRPTGMPSSRKSRRK